jgi:hypothetical protein
LLGLLEGLRTTPARPSTRPTGDAEQMVSHKIEFSYLNPNLMVPKIDHITLSIRTEKADKVFYLHDAMTALMSAPSLPYARRETPAEDKSPCPYRERNHE